MTTRLYHFTAGVFLPGIKRDGLTKGVTPIRVGGLLGFIHHTQWLTKSPNFEQPWCDGKGSLAYDRTEYRLTVDVPDLMYGCMIPWKDMKRRIRSVMLKGFDEHEDVRNWMVYCGVVRFDWIVDVAKNPKMEAA